MKKDEQQFFTILKANNKGVDLCDEILPTLKLEWDHIIARSRPESSNGISNISGLSQNDNSRCSFTDKHNVVTLGYLKNREKNPEYVTPSDVIRALKETEKLAQDIGIPMITNNNEEDVKELKGTYICPFTGFNMKQFMQRSHNYSRDLAERSKDDSYIICHFIVNQLIGRDSVHFIHSDEALQTYDNLEKMLSIAEEG